MKLARVGLVIITSLALMVSVCLPVQADDSKAEVELKVNIVAAPSVTTNEATKIKPRRATLNGSLTSLGTASSVAVSFDWGLTTAYGSTTKPRTMTSTGDFRATITGLTPDTTYHFRAKAEGDVTRYGLDETFTTRRQWRRKWLGWLFPWLKG